MVVARSIPVRLRALGRGDVMRAKMVAAMRCNTGR
jgi:hypothetical protein